jgi:hypothetical protein
MAPSLRLLRVPGTKGSNLSSSSGESANSRSQLDPGDPILTVEVVQLSIMVVSWIVQATPLLTGTGRCASTRHFDKFRSLVLIGIPVEAAAAGVFWLSLIDPLRLARDVDLRSCRVPAAGPDVGGSDRPERAEYR